MLVEVVSLNIICNVPIISALEDNNDGNYVLLTV